MEMYDHGFPKIFQSHFFLGYVTLSAREVEQEIDGEGGGVDRQKKGDIKKREKRSLRTVR